jgi:hypothetical protein
MDIKDVRRLYKSIEALPHLCSNPPAEAPPAGALPGRCPCERAKARVFHLLASAECQGRDEADVIAEQFQKYRLWCIHVLQNRQEASKTFTRMDYYVYHILSISLGNFDNATPALKHYLFFRVCYGLKQGEDVGAYLWGGRPEGRPAKAGAGMGVPQSLNLILTSHMREYSPQF